MTAPELTPDERRAQRLAMLLDLRMFIGSLFVVFGVIVTYSGVTASQAEIDKAAGINLALWMGLIMLAMGLLFVVWNLLSPPQVQRSVEMTEEDLPAPLRHAGLEDVPEHHGDPRPPH